MNKEELNIQIPKKIIPFIWFSIKGVRILTIIRTILLIIVGVATGFGIPYISKKLVTVIENYDGNTEMFFSKVGIYFIIFVASLIVTALIDALSMFLGSITQPNIQKRTYMLLFNDLQSHSTKFLTDNMAGYISNKISDVVHNSRRILRTCLFEFLPTLCVISVNIVAFFLIQPIFSFFILAWLVLNLIVLKILGPKITNLNKINAENRSVMNGFMIDSITNFSIVKNFASSKSEYKILDKKQEKLRLSWRKIWRTYDLLNLFFNILYALFYIVLFYYIGVNLKYGKISTGDIIYIIFATNVIVQRFARLVFDMQEFIEEIAIIKKGLEVLTKEKEIVDKKNAKNLVVKKAKIDIKSLYFKYKKKWILENFNLSIKHNEKVGLVGLSGAGKSTLVHLILRLYDVNKGEICIDDQNIANVKQNSLRKAISFVSQDNSLFHRTIKDNICYANPKACKMNMVKASKMAHAHEFISEMEKGYESKVGERGVKLSGGQRQRIAIARAFLKDAKILILDEATSSLDSETEKIIQDSLSKLMQKRTTIAIAHRLSTLRQMDRIIVLDKGKIIEEGTHNQLIHKKGLYYKLWTMQSDGFIPEKI